jgi:hypothetical protein
MGRMKLKKHLLKTVLMAGGAFVVATANASAAVVETFEVGRDGFKPPEEQMAVPWAAMMLGLLALIVVLGPAFLSAKRSHLD